MWFRSLLVASDGCERPEREESEYEHPIVGTDEVAQASTGTDRARETEEKPHWSDAAARPTYGHLTAVMRQKHALRER